MLKEMKCPAFQTLCQHDNAINHCRLNFKSCSFFSSFDFNSGTLVLWDESSWMWLQTTIIQFRLPE